MRRLVTTRLVGERGAVLVHVSTALLAFTALTAVMADFGLQVVARNEVQTAADAAAIAGATALALDSYEDRGETGPAVTTAIAVAEQNLVHQAPPAVTAAADVLFEECTSMWMGAPSPSPRFGCIEVTAHRDSARGNPISTLFGSLLGYSGYEVSASAVAEAIDANATDCLKPLAVPDRWNERKPADTNVWLVTSTFARWDPAAPAMLLPAPRDGYSRPTDIGPGSGMQMTGLVDNEVWFGKQVTLSPGDITSPIASITAWHYLPVQIPGSVWGANAVQDNTRFCAGAAGQVSVGDALGLAPGGVAANVPSITAGINQLVARDPAAVWNAATRRVENSCADRLDGRCASMSPRIIAIALYDPIVFADDCHAGVPAQVRVRNIAGFFIESVSGNDVTGRITRHPGQHDSSALTLFDASVFLRASLLVE